MRGELDAFPVGWGAAAEGPHPPLPRQERREGCKRQGPVGSRRHRLHRLDGAVSRAKKDRLPRRRQPGDALEGRKRPRGLKPHQLGRHEAGPRRLRQRLEACPAGWAPSPRAAATSWGIPVWAQEAAQGRPPVGTNVPKANCPIGRALVLAGKNPCACS